ncbi:Domain of unknown function (DUF966 [Striga hermonthica]|uniref:SOSEKI DIX-like domain-containing protein n=1 Tax=Striga hermonthica TaxID=68872 RepID=A0A9N7MLS3_STRHE|nr:Domain of unknown function (DUF966 [Striga hermonthica]
MEGPSCCSQVRRVHIVYFLSRKGKIEHPHLVRVHHPSTNGVRLRDVKRWLGELRGKDMPESFSWSYKRKYKTGYVWQDLVDDDLINPISDNEYVLKGSQILSTTIKDEKLLVNKDQFLQEDSKITTTKEENEQSHNSSEYISTKSSCEIEQESPSFGSESSTLTEDSIKADKTDKMQSSKSSRDGKRDEKNHKNSPLHFYSALLSKKNNKKTTKKVATGEKTRPSDDSKLSASKSKSTTNANGSSNMLRNLITCGPLYTNDSVVVARNKQNNNNSNNNRLNLLNMRSSDFRNVVCKGDQLGGSQRILTTPKWTQHQLLSCGRKSFDGVKDSLKSKSDLRDKTTPSATYIPANVPDCWQCGNPIKPEKLHAHLKPCKGMTAMAKTPTISPNVDKASS